MGIDTHLFKDVTTGSEIAGEGPFGNTRKFGQLTFADEKVTIIEIYHFSEVKEVIEVREVKEVISVISVISV